MKLTLYSSPGCGSTVVEAVLELLDLPYENIPVDWDRRSTWNIIAPHNPLKQVPTLVVDDAFVMTESAAIVQWLLDLHPESPLLPPAASPARAAFRRWLTFIPANIYAAISVSDFPARWVEGEAARKSLGKVARERVKEFWMIPEAALTPAPFLLGETMTALDLYVAMVTRWRPGRDWFGEHCPKLMAAVLLTEQHPVVKDVWKRNFG